MTVANFSSGWLKPPEILSIEREEVHVWLLTLDEYVVYFERFLAWLAPEELERVWRYYFQKDRERFAVARAMVKTILSGYLNVPRTNVKFRYNSFGKPRLADPGPADLRFNVSHSGDLALLAVTIKSEVGIDLEYQHREMEIEGIASRFFSAAEVESLTKLPRDLQTEGFFKCWTRKEAYIKAIGEGLSFPLDKFSVSLHPLKPPELLNVVGNNRETSRWRFWDVSPNLQYAAALVAEGSKLRLSRFQAVAEVAGVTDSGSSRACRYG